MVSKAQYLGTLSPMYFGTQTSMNAMTSGITIGQFAYCLDVKKLFIFNGLAWMPSTALNVKKSTVVINGKASGTTQIYLMEQSPSYFYPTQIIARAISVTGVSIPATISVGTNAPNYNNIASSSLLSTVMTTVSATGGAPQNASFSYPISGGTGIYANVTIPATATTYTLTIEVIGFYDNN